MELDSANLQVLCKKCNKEKGYKDETDYRTPANLERLEFYRLRNKLIKQYYGYRTKNNSKLNRKANWLKWQKSKSFVENLEE